MKKNIFYISTACDDEEFEFILGTCKTIKPTIAGVRFDRIIAKYLNENLDVNTFSYRPISSFPDSKKVLLKKYKKKMENYNITYSFLINIPILKQIFFIFSVFINLIEWNKKYSKDSKLILVSSPLDVFLIPSIIFKKLTKLKIVCIVPDIQQLTIEYRNDNSRLKKILVSLSSILNQYLIKNIDSFIFLTEYMNEKLNVKQKPYIVMEGLLEFNENINIYSDKTSNEKFIMMYAGGLHENYGIKLLIEAIQLIPNDNFELWIFGSGDYESKIEQLSKNDMRIKYFGVVSHNEILKHQKNVNLLINPRPSHLEYTKYSFPSKLIEYLGSGTPTISTKLRGIPKEYDDYLLFFKEETPESIKNSLIEIMNKNINELNQFGMKSQSFVLKNKTAKKQVKKIEDFICEII